MDLYPEVEWAVPVDQHILRELDTYGWQSPKTLALNLPFSRQWIADRTRVLADYGLLERHEETVAYRITKYGREVVAGNVTADELNKLNPEP